MRKAFTALLISGCVTTAPDGDLGGRADDDSTSGDIAAWATRPVKISADHAVAILPAPDESRLAYSRNAADYTAWGCWGWGGIGDLWLVDATTPAEPINVSSLAGFRESAFTTDSAQLVYTQYTAGINPCSDSVGIVAAPAVGGAAKWLHQGLTYYYRHLNVAGSSVVFVAFGGGENTPGTLYQTGTNDGSTYLGYGAGRTVVSQDPTGRSLVYDSSDGRLQLRQLGTTTDVDLSATYSRPHAPLWTPDGATLAISWVENDMITVTLMASDGSSPRTALTGCGREVKISSDGAWIACSAPNALHVAPVAGGAQFSLSGLPDATTNAWWYFTPDNRFIHFIDRGAGNHRDAWYSAPVSAGSAFTQVTDSLSLMGQTTTAAHDYLAYVRLDENFTKSLVVVDPKGNATTVVPSGVDNAAYEQTGGRKLAVIANGQASIYATDGSGTPIALPGTATKIPAPFWKDDVLFYAVNKRNVDGEETFDLIAASEDGSQVGVVLAGVTRVRTKQRMFLARAKGVGGGLYVFDD